MEYRFDWRMDFGGPSAEDIVFCRLTGANDDDEDVEVLDGISMVAIVMDLGSI